jgi:hypothetical protein
MVLVRSHQTSMVQPVVPVVVAVTPLLLISQSLVVPVEQEILHLHHHHKETLAVMVAQTHQGKPVLVAVAVVRVGQAAPLTSDGGSGGAATSPAIKGTPIALAAGGAGGGAAKPAGAANTGNGGGMSNAGGSGRVIIRWLA